MAASINVEIQRTGDPENGQIQKVLVELGGSRRLEVLADGHAVHVLLADGSQTASLRSLPRRWDCTFRRAVNLLRLHLPECREAKA